MNKVTGKESSSAPMFSKQNCGSYTCQFVKAIEKRDDTMLHNIIVGATTLVPYTLDALWGEESSLPNHALFLWYLAFELHLRFRSLQATHSFNCFAMHIVSQLHCQSHSPLVTQTKARIVKKKKRSKKVKKSAKKAVVNKEWIINK